VGTERIPVSDPRYLLTVDITQAERKARRPVHVGCDPVFSFAYDHYRPSDWGVPARSPAS